MKNSFSLRIFFLFIIASTCSHCEAQSFLKVNPGTSMIVDGATITIGDSVSSQGTFDVTNGTVEMNGVVAQIIPANTFATHKIKNLVINNNVTLFGPDSITGTLSFKGSNRSFSTGDSLTLKSTANATASFADVTNGGTSSGNSISGNVIVERYIPAHKAWRFLSVPTNTTQSVKATWQEGALNSASDPVTGFGTQISSNRTTWALEGFDLFSQGGPSMKTFDPATSSWMGITHTDTAMITRRGYMTFIRGDRTATAYNSSPTETVMRTKGALYFGDLAPVNVAPSLFASVGNPYASPVDLRYINKTGIKDFFYVWDPNIGGNYGYGGYQTFSYDGSNYTVTPGLGSYGASGSTNNCIESGLAFLVQATAAGGNVTFSESAKCGNNASSARLPQTLLRTNIYGINADGSNYIVDGVLNNYGDNYSNAIDDKDAVKSPNSGESLAISAGSRLLVIERRHSISSEDTIFLNLVHVKFQEYQFKFIAENLSQPGLTGYLEDGFVHSRTMLDLNGTTAINFSVVNIPGSYASNRFRVVFTPAVVLPLGLVSLKAYQLNKNIEVEWKVENESNMTRYEVEKSVDDNHYTRVHAVAARNGALNNYQWLDEHAMEGYNYYRIKCIDFNADVKYSNVVKVPVRSVTPVPSITVYPNPVTGNAISVMLANIEKGDYRLQLYNSSGQLMAMKTILYDGTNPSQNFDISEGFAAGKYELKLTGSNVNLSVPVFKK